MENIGNQVARLETQERSHVSTIRELSVVGFRSFAHLDGLRLTARNILVGANGSGKSNFVEIFHFLDAVRDAHLEEFVARAGGADPILHYGASNTETMSVRILFDQPRWGLELILEPTDDQRLFVKSQITHNLHGVASMSWGSWPEAGIGGDPVDPAQARDKRFLESWRIYGFRGVGPGSPLRKNCDLYDCETLHSDGSNLASFLYYLGEKHRKSYDRIRDSVHLVAPFFEEFDIRPFALDERILRLRWRHTALDDPSGRTGTRVAPPRDQCPGVAHPECLRQNPDGRLHPIRATDRLVRAGRYPRRGSR